MHLPPAACPAPRRPYDKLRHASDVDCRCAENIGLHATSAPTRSTLDKSRSRLLFSFSMNIEKENNPRGGRASRAGVRMAGSPIEFRLDTGSGVPTYLQLVQQV